MQKIWIIGASPPLCRLELPKDMVIDNIAVSKTMVYFTTSNETIGSFPIPSGSDEVISHETVKFEVAPNVVQIVCGNDYVAYRTSSGEIFARGGQFPPVFTKIKNKKETMPPAVSISGTPHVLFAIISFGRFCIITGNSVIYHKKKSTDRWYIASTMFLGTVLLLGHSGRAYTMTFNELNPSLSNTLQVFTEDPCFFTAVYSSNESLFFLTVNDSLVSYGYNHYGCLGVHNENTVNSLVMYKPSLNGESICEIAPSSDFTFFLTPNGNLFFAGMSPYDKACSSQLLIFKPLEGKRITQIKALGNVCIALEGGHRDYNSTSTPSDSYKHFPIVKVPTYYTGLLGGMIQVLPFPKDYTHMWYFPGDIVIRKDTKGMVVGVTYSGEPIIAVANLKRVIVFYDCIHQDFLVRRPGHVTEIVTTESNRNIIVDTTNSLISYFGGLKKNDFVQSTKGICGTVIGVRGPYVWITPKNESYALNFSSDELTLISRPSSNGNLKKIIPIIFNNSEKIWVKPEESIESNTETLYFSPNLGLCYKVGTTKSFGFYRRIDESKIYIRSQEPFPAVRSKNYDFTFHSIFQYNSDSTKNQILLSNFQIAQNVNTSTESTSPFGFLVFDRVITPKGYGTVLGVHDNKIIAITDKMYITRSLADKFDPSELEIVARADKNEYTKKYKLESNDEIELLINISAFTDLPFIIQDRILTKDEKFGFICGVSKQGTLYMKMDNESFVRPLDRQCIKIMRYMQIMSHGYQSQQQKMTIFRTIMVMSGLTIKPGDMLKPNPDANSSHRKNEVSIPHICIGVVTNELFAFAPLNDLFNPSSELNILFSSSSAIDYSSIIHEWPPI